LEIASGPQNELSQQYWEIAKAFRKSLRGDFLDKNRVEHCSIHTVNNVVGVAQHTGSVGGLEQPSAGDVQQRRKRVIASVLQRKNRVEHCSIHTEIR